MRPFTSTISLTQALAIMGDAAPLVDRTEWISIDDASGRVAADDVRASANVPPFDRAAMDGYAVRAEDLADASADRATVLRRIGAVFPGDLPTTDIGAGECLAIATGAPIPPGADAVVMVEQTTSDAPDRILVNAPASRGQHVTPRGSDMASGEIVIRSGAVLTPARVGLLAALGRDQVLVYARPRVFLASSGNELVEPGQPLAAGRIYEVNRYALAPVVRANGGLPLLGTTARDSIEALAACLEEAERVDADLIVISGGSSVGDRDVLIDALRERGEILFHGISVKPGRPTLFARIRARIVLGMPGNPTSCLSNAYILLIPLLRRMARLRPWRPETLRVPLAREIVNSSGRDFFFAVRLECGEAVPAFKGSGHITSLADADGYIEVPADVTRIDAGVEVTVKLF